MKAANTLYYGDNLKILRQYIEDESVDLVYLDPPFNSNADYNVLFAEKGGEKAHAQIQAFEDTWEWDTEASLNFTDAVENGGTRVARAMLALRALLPASDMLAYLSMMAPRLVELRRVLQPNGSIYLHCDPTASHYLKLLMDAVFGPENFQSEIIWRRTTAKGLATRALPNNHDCIFCYHKSQEFTFNPIYFPHSQERIDKHYSQIEEGTGRRYTLSDLLNPNPDRPNLRYEFMGLTRVWRWTKERMEEANANGLIVKTKSGTPRYKRYLDEQVGVPIDDVWIDIFPINSRAEERLGYPTQKPEALLERIIKSSTSDGAIVLDPFCGCGTAIAAAQKLNRKWIGIDITHLAIKLIKGRLADAFGKQIEKKYNVIGEPADLESAKALAKKDKYEFQYWALGLAHPQAQPKPEDRKKGADHGIDGRMWITDASGEIREVIISVKGGHVTVSQVRDLRRVIERDNAAIGVFICIEEPTTPMRKEATDAGFFKAKTVGATKHPRLQILTIEDLMAGKRIDLPAQADIRSFKQAPKAKGKGHKQSALFEKEEESPF